MITQTLPKGFVVRHPTMDDMEAALNVFQACEVALDGVVETTLDDMRIWWQYPTLDLSKDIWLVLSPEEKIVAVADMRQDEHARIYTDANVLPEYYGRGIGTYLLRLMEERAYEHLSLATPGVRVSTLSWIHAKNAAAPSLLEKHGFKRIRTSWRMGIELHEVPPAPVWAEGIQLVTLASNMDLMLAVYEADEESFQDHWGHMPHTFEEFEHWEAKREHFDPSLWFIAMDGNEVAGVCLCADENESGGWVHSLGVRRQWRRKGIGLAFLYHAFGEFYRRGVHNVYLGVDAHSLTGATRLYKRAGMHVVRQYNIYEKELRAGRELSTQSVDV